MEGDLEPDAETDGAPTSRLRPASSVARRLIDATIESIDEGGETAVRVQEIVAAVGVQIPVLYRHFGNREGLIQAAQAHRLMRDLDAEVRAVDAALDAIDSAEGFRALMEALLKRMCSDERRPLRWKRVNVIGSTYGRPELAAEVADIQRAAVDRIATTLRRAQDAGWLRAELDLDVFAAWFAGQAIGRIVVDLGDIGIDIAAYDAMWADAILHACFG